LRHIPRRSKRPDDAWLTKAGRLLKDLDEAPDAAARNKIIDDNTKAWGELKDWLLELSHQKCWFSEAKDCFSHWDVEHYRPKKSAKDKNGTENEGYWWLAFDWQNLRICGNVGNRKKGTFFPLRPGCARLARHSDLRYEDPLLLDPAHETDPNLLSFDFEGNAIPAASAQDAWDQERVEYSIERYNLNFPRLTDKRKAVWSECWGRIQEYLQELGTYNRDRTNMIAKESSREAAKYVRELMREEQEFSSVARACVLSTGDPRVLGLLQSA
jgi:uncharacterized protein (TIGR02646 family)